MIQDDRRLGLKLFLTCWIVYAMHFATDISREHYPAFSLAERGTLRVDPYLGLHDDIFEIEGRGAFINNNPGASLVGAIPYAILRPLVDRAVAGVMARRAAPGGNPSQTYDDPRPERQRFFRQARERGLDVRFGLAAGLMQLFAFAPLSAAAVLVMRSLLLRMGVSAARSVWLALLYGFGTPIFFRSAYLNHNLLVAHATLASFTLLFVPGSIEQRPWRLFVAGLAAGYGLLCDYAGVVPLVALGVYALTKLWAQAGFQRGVLRMCWMVAGGCIPVGALLGYQAWVFGSPFLPAQSYMPATHLSVHGWYGLDWPAPDLLLLNCFDPRFGLFAYGPILLLAFAAPFVPRDARLRMARGEIAVIFGLFLMLLVFTSANQFARLQWITGVRMMVPAVPMLFLSAAAVLLRLPVRVAAVLGGLAIAHGWCTAMVRGDAFGSVLTVLREGPKLPWLTSMWRAGDAYLPILSRMGDQAWPVVLVGALVILGLWWRPLRRSVAASLVRTDR